MIDTFATPILNFSLQQDAEDMLTDIQTYLLASEPAEKTGPRYSLEGETGWHSPSNLANLEYAWSEKLKNTILDISQGYADGIQAPLGFMREYVDVKCWGMLIRKGDSSSVHCHPNSVMSGTLWIDAPEDMSGGQLCFVDPRGGARSDPLFGGNTMHFNPKRGTGVVFPSWLDHYVLPHTSSGTRISIAWNIDNKLAKPEM